MTIATSPFTVTSEPLDEDTAARVALAIAGVSGNHSVAIGIRVAGGAARFIAAVHDQEDAAIPLSAQTRARIRARGIAARVAGVLETTARAGLRLVTPLSPAWPSGLDDLRGAVPLVLWARGDIAALLAPAIALTGTTTPSPFAAHMAIELGTGLAGRGWSIAASTSPGIDQLALRAAEAMHGHGIAVTGAPLDTVTKSPTVDVLVSEIPPGIVMSVDAQRRAKRLLAALTAKTIVVEAPTGSGPIRTAQAAHAIGRPIGIVPPIDEGIGGDGVRLLAEKHGASPVLSIKDADRLR